MEAEIREIASDNVIKLRKNEDILRLRIVDEDGNDTGESLVFNLEDIELPIKYQEIIERDKKARTHLKFRLEEIKRTPDKKGKKLLSANEEAQIKATQDFYREEVQIYNMFLGERGVEKLLNGRELSWSTLEEIDEIIENAILPKLKVSAESIKQKIMKKYEDKRSDVIE